MPKGGGLFSAPPTAAPCASADPIAMNMVLGPARQEYREDMPQPGSLCEAAGRRLGPAAPVSAAAARGAALLGESASASSDRNAAASRKAWAGNGHARAAGAAGRSDDARPTEGSMTVTGGLPCSAHRRCEAGKESRGKQRRPCERRIKVVGGGRFLIRPFRRPNQFGLDSADDRQCQRKRSIRRSRRTVTAFYRIFMTAPSLRHRFFIAYGLNQSAAAPLPTRDGGAGDLKCSTP